MKHIILGILLALVSSAQTTVNGGRTYLGPQDMSGATDTKPVKSGTSLPGSCTVPSMFFKTDATAGRNLYFCTATNTWTQMTGSTVPGSDTQVVFNDGGALSGDNGLTYNKSFDILGVSGGMFVGNLGIDFTESDTNPGCSANVFSIYADLSEAKLKKCQNGVSSDLDTGAAADPNMVTAAGTLTSNAPMIGAGSKAAAVGSRSGNTTEFATISGTKTASKQATFDASGNIVASAYDVGAAGADTQLQSTVSSSTITIAAGVAGCKTTTAYVNNVALSAATIVETSSGTGTISIGYECSTGSPVLVARVDTGLTLGQFACTGITCTSATGFQPKDYVLATVAISSGTLQTPVDLRPKAVYQERTVGTGLAESGNTISLGTFTLKTKVALPLVACSGTTGTLMWDTLATNVPTATCSAGSTETAMIRGTADWPDSDGDYSVQTAFLMPDDWDTSSALDAIILWRTTATSGNAVFQIQTACRADGEVDDVTWNTASTVTDAAKGTTNQLNSAVITNITKTGNSDCAAGELLHVRLLRNRTHASDTLAAALSIGHVELTARRSITQ